MVCQLLVPLDANDVSICVLTPAEQSIEDQAESTLSPRNDLVGLLSTFHGFESAAEIKLFADRSQSSQSSVCVDETAHVLNSSLTTNLPTTHDFREICDTRAVVGDRSSDECQEDEEACSLVADHQLFLDPTWPKKRNIVHFILAPI